MKYSKQEATSDYFYGDFTEYKEPQVSRRSPSVALTALEKCEDLMDEVEMLCRMVGQKELEIARLKEKNEQLQERIQILRDKNEK